MTGQFGRRSVLPVGGLAVTTAGPDSPIPLVDLVRAAPHDALLWPTSGLGVVIGLFEWQVRGFVRSRQARRPAGRRTSRRTGLKI
ncbi:hypothetical protein ACLGIH_00280 [Streptomyces sp. HMX87]|uniref:hypothetical protein n=1 Tax=Streptomyces sp. HMX87 TaxID=3390849 RepID=UPI003A853BD8